MTLEEERRHLAEGVLDESPPPSLDARTVECPGGAVRALERAREVLGVVLEHQEGAWPGVDQWKADLPTWFVEACVDDREVKDCVLDRWSLRAWLHWLQPDQRQWRWWDASAADRTHLTVRVLPLAEPYLRGSLDWLLTVAGLPA